MDFKQIYTPGLAHCSYILGGENGCIVIDPARDVQVYLDAALGYQLPIIAILETHLHADFVSGHIELAERTGATIYMSKTANALFNHHALEDGEEWQIDSFHIKMLDTPGHTPDCSVFLVADTTRGPEFVLAFTGDTLLIGDAGRPDLFPTKKNQLAIQLYHSLRKIEAYGDNIEVYPAHGAGSLCGKALSSKLSSTLGTERIHNEAMKLHPLEAFVDSFLKDMPEAPDHFSRCSEMNRLGPANTQYLEKPKALLPKEFKEEMDAGAIVVDTRDVLPFASAHIPNAYGLSLRGNFATFAGWILPPDPTILLVADSENDVEIACKGLYSVGLDRVKGYLKGGMNGFAMKGFRTSRLASISIEELREKLEKKEVTLVDTRLKSEWDTFHILDSMHMPAPDVRARATEIPVNKPVAFICNSGNRSLLAASLFLQKRNDIEVMNVLGGTSVWNALGYPIE